MQGEGAAEKIAEAIRIMNDKKLADVIILARGGGSLEDLWPFNEEIVARAIYNSELPIISAVGHETDFTIADFVADLRAPTPSAAAELAVPDIQEVYKKINNYENRLKQSLKKKVEFMRLRFEKCMKSRVFTDPTRQINEQYVRIDMIVKKMENNVIQKINENKNKSIKVIAKLDTLSPLKTLTRGFCIAQKSGKVIRAAKDLNFDDEIQLKFHDGTKKAKVIKDSVK